MESLGTIRYYCLKTISVFYSYVENKYKKECSKALFFIPVFINDSKRSKRYVYNKATMSPLLLRYHPKIRMNKLVSIIYRNQANISWVDFKPIVLNKVSVFIVEMVCLNKTDNKLKYHLSWSDSIMV